MRALPVQARGTQFLFQRPHENPGLAAPIYISCTLLSSGDKGGSAKDLFWPLECTGTVHTQTHACTPYTHRSNAHTQQ